MPDRILLAGSEQHVPAHTSTPPELMIDQRVLPPTPEHVRVQTPPRSDRAQWLWFKLQFLSSLNTILYVLIVLFAQVG